MRYVIHVAGMPFDGNTINEGKSLGGSESAGYYVAKELAKRGHEVFCFSNIPDGKPKKIDGVSYLPLGQVSENAPFGENFMSYAEKVPSDVILAQRDPRIFLKQYNSKVNLWWTHDLALKRSQPMVHAQSWNIDKIMTVSQFHSDQIEKVYGFKADFMNILPNGIDTSLYEGEALSDQKWMSKTMVYSSRPERGLENLVKPGGIMEKLLEVDPEIKLVVCGYDNTSQEMAPYYQYLWDRCNALPNVDNYGPLSKADLANLERGCWLHIYPTEFEETSCITAMQQQAAGTPFVTTKTGALTETLKDGGVVWVEKDKEGHPDVDNFVATVKKLLNDPEQWLDLHKKALRKSKEYSWERSVDFLESTVEDVFYENTKNKATLVNHYINNSDVVAAKRLTTNDPELKKYDDFIEKHFKFAFEGDFKKHYDQVASYNTAKENHHNLGHDDHLLSMPRMKPIVDFLETVPSGKTVLDYGCCVGQQTVAYARKYPELKFIGVDIAQEQIDIGTKFVKDNNIDNLTFLQADSPYDLKKKLKHKPDVILCTEVLEHTLDPNKFLDDLESCAREFIIFSTPSGPYEELRWNQQLVREHLHHFEEKDLHDMLGHKPNFRVTYVAAEKNKYGEWLGNYCFMWAVDHSAPSRPIDYDRKNKYQSPRQTMSACMIVKSDGDVLARCLKSIVDIVDEIIIGIDGKEGEGRAWDIAEEFGAITFEAKSPLDIGFDAARNATIEKASSDWILWIDDDETFEWSHKFRKYLRNNMYDSYAINQEHYGIEPPGLIKTDMPCRVFRNHLGIQFFGRAHEHPEIEMNKGCGQSYLIPRTHGLIKHDGYSDEETRRKRFIRNWPLMQRDHEENPDRELGRFLYLRDLIHLNRFEREASNNVMTNEIKERYELALEMWRDLLKEKKLRLVVDALPYASEAAMVLTNNKALQFEFGASSNLLGIGDKMDKPVKSIQGMFMNEADAKAMTDLILEDKLKRFDEDYL